MLERLFAADLQRILEQAGNPRTIVAALSGGMDSVVLVHLLAGNPPPDTRIVAAHLNHNLRPASGIDRDFCLDLAARLGLDFAARDADVLATARDERLGIEEAGRLVRYRFFRELCGDGGLVLTGHHADDQAETILMNLRRGAHRRGLGGMRPFALVPIPPGLRVPVGRPLLARGRDALAAYAAERGLRWREDESNADTVFYRNRIRRRIMPALEQLLPGFRDRLLERAERLRAEEERFAARGRELARRLARRENNGRFLRIDAEALAEPERLLYAIRHVVEEEMGGLLPYGAVLSRVSQLAGMGRLGETLSLPGRLQARKEHDGVFFFFPDAGEEDGGGEIILPDPPFAVRAGGMLVSAEWRPCGGLPPPGDMTDPHVEWFDPAAIRWPLRLRPPFPGERFRPLGAPGSRKIQDILVDCKSPRRKRGLARVVADHSGALWVWPYRVANRARIRGVTDRALRIRMVEEIGEISGGAEEG